MIDVEAQVALLVLAKWAQIWQGDELGHRRIKRHRCSFHWTVELRVEKYIRRAASRGEVGWGDHPSIWNLSILMEPSSQPQSRQQLPQSPLPSLLGHSAYFNTAVTKQDFMKILGVSSQKWCKIISYYHGDVKQTMVYLIAPSVLILIKWDVTKQDFFLVLWLNHLQLLSKIIGYYHGNRE